jgi:hypothetical protein
MNLGVGLSLATCANFEEVEFDDTLGELSSSANTIDVQPGTLKNGVAPPLTPDYFWGASNSGANEVGPVDKHSVSLNIRHVRQLHTWDCGVACVQMILRLHKTYHL